MNIEQLAEGEEEGIDGGLAIQFWMLKNIYLVSSCLRHCLLFGVDVEG